MEFITPPGILNSWFAKLKRTFCNIILGKNSEKKVDNKFRVPRIWSNNQLRQYSSLFHGKIINVSARFDEDKQGNYYREYFPNADEYWISNFEDIGDKQLSPNGLLYIDLEQDILQEYQEQFDVVFNHTTLEHVFECRHAFRNLCQLSKDVVIVVVPYIQQLHGDGYYDFWRFTPYTMKRLYEENNLKLRFCAANGKDYASIYLFCIGYRNSKWDKSIPYRFDIKIDENKEIYFENYSNVIGANVIR